ncbi:mannose-6-phosphate isomerase [Lachnospiraceae bacterium NE2001]|nr:mannose-6-phosphate isomerase [Lachnospiraceae bacterium NE2001]
MEPLLLNPAGKDYLWGGTRLKKEYGKDIPLVPLAETWECSVHPDGLSIVVNGTFAGKTLKSVLDRNPRWLGNKVGKDLPILIKFIDAEKDLSVQVHPDDEYARENEGQNGKTEMWYVLDAVPGAELIYGFEHDVTPDKLRYAVNSGTLSKHLKKVKVRRGDTFFITPGTVHAIGAGIMVAEIQESSNVTYRVYDYDRLDKDGKKRPLHIEKALEVANLRASNGIKQPPKFIKYYPGCAREILCRCKYFEVERVQVSMGFSFSVTEDSYQVLLCTEGFGGIETEYSRRPLRFAKGDCIFLPAAIGRCHVLGNTTLLKIRN